MKSVILIGLGIIVAGAVGCGRSSSMQERTHFSKADSLTDIYLVLQDSLLESWNRVIKLELDRKEALSTIIEELQHSTVIDAEQSHAYTDQLDQIERIRFTQKSMTDPHVIQEYDRAFDDLLQKITSLTVVDAKLSTNLGNIETIGEFNIQQRHYYDSLARQFNAFIKVNWTDLEELGTSVQLEQKPLFVTVDNR